MVNTARDQNHFTSLGSYVADEGVFVESQPDAVAADIFYHGISVCAGVGIDCIGDVAQMSPWFCFLKSQFDTFFRDTDKLVCFRRDGSRW